MLPWKPLQSSLLFAGNTNSLSWSGVGYLKGALLRRALTLPAYIKLDCLGLQGANTPAYYPLESVSNTVRIIALTNDITVIKLLKFVTDEKAK